MNNNYPAGAECDSRAPWNEQKLPEQEVEVTCSNTLSKSTTISVDDYEVTEYDEKGNPCFDYSDSDLKKVFLNNYYTAKEALDLAAEFAKKVYTTLDRKEHSGLVSAAVDVFNACEGWNEDELEIVL